MTTVRDPNMIGAMPHNQNIPWLRLAAESTAIVLSILVAFAIDAWWEERQERQDERRYLLSLRQELSSGMEFLAERENTNADMADAHVALIGQMQGDPRATDDSLFYWLSLASRPGEIDLPRVVFDDLQSSGGTQLIRSDELRVALALYGRRLANIGEVTDRAWAIWEQRIQPYLEGRVPRTDRLIRGSFGRSQQALGNDLPFGLSQNEADFGGILADPAFEDMLAERWLRLATGTLSIGRLRESMNEIIDLIDEELASSDP